MLFGKEIRGTYARSFFPWLRLFIGFGMHGSNIITILGALHPRKNQTLLSESTSLVDHWRLNCAFLLNSLFEVPTPVFGDPVFGPVF